ncbi:MAG TPA: beta-galactosidase domain 4-containing protein [Anseongella sp.]|nr:beta-galactosidase domain 4-containing protein [Anseongella sp.]
MPGKLSLRSLLLCSVLTVHLPLAGQTPSAVEGAAAAELNRLPPRARYFAYESLEKAIAGKPEVSKRFISLNGAWKVYSPGKGKSLPENFYAPDFNDAAWDTVRLPAIREVSAGGDGKVLYRRIVRLEEDWAAGEVFISLDGVRPAFTLWVNGRKAGHAENNALEAEFNIGALLRPGENLLAIEVPGCPDVGSPACPGGIPGISGEMFLHRRPAIHLWDISVQSGLDESYRNGVFALSLQVESRMDSVKERFWGFLKEPVYSSVNIQAELVDEEGRTVLSFRESKAKQIRGGDRVSFSFQGEVPDVAAWSHEMPRLYRLDIVLLNEAGQVLEAVSRKIGFREAALEDGQLSVNGQQVLLKAFNLEAGQLAGRQKMLEDVQQIKQGNFNVVRPPHRLNPYWYELCDQYGIYIAQESNPGNKNNPSVIPELADGYQALWRGQQHVGLQLLDFLKSTVRVSNRYAFRDLSNYYLEWEVLENGKKSEGGRINELPLASREESGFTLGYKTRFYPGNDYFLNLKIKTKTEEPMIPADFAVASRQFRLGPYQYEQTYEVDKGQIDASEDPELIVLNGYDFRIEFDKAAGQISRYSYKGKELLGKGPGLDFRERQEPEDSLQAGRAVWTAAVEEGNLIEYKVTEDVNGNYYVTFTTVLLGGDARLFQKFRVDGRGSILVENVFVRMEGTYPLMPAFGTRFELPYDYERMEWYGREPEQRNEVGIYSASLDALNSNKTDVRWIRLIRKDGYGITIRKEDALLHLGTDQDQQEGGPVVLSVDLSQKPLPYKSYIFTYRIIPNAFSATAQ